MLLLEQMNEETQKQNSQSNTGNNDLPQQKVVSDIVLESEKELTIPDPQKKDVQPSFANVPSLPPTPVSFQSKSDNPIVKKDYEVLTAAPKRSSGEKESENVVIGVDEKKVINPWLLIVPIVLLVIAGVVYAVYSGYFTLPFGPSKEDVLNKMFDSLSGIDSARYSYDLSFKSEPRSPGAKALDIQELIKGVGNLNGGGMAVGRDASRLAAISSIQKGLVLYKKENGKYPQFLIDVKTAGKNDIYDPLTKNQYGYRQEKNGFDYTLHVRMETGDGIAAYRAAVLTLPSDSLNTKENNLAEVHSATPELKEVSIPKEDAKSATSFDPSLIFQSLPVDIDAGLKLSGLTQLNTNNVSVDASGKLSLGSISFSGGLSFVNKDNVSYVKINEAPSFGIFDLAALKGQWVKVDNKEFSTSNESSRQFEMQKEVREKGVRLVKLFLQILKEEKALVVKKELPKVRLDDGTYYRYLVSFDGEKTANIYERLNAEVKKEFDIKTDVLPPEMSAYLRSSEYLKMTDISQENTHTEILINTKTYFPRKVSSDSVFVPPDNVQKLKNRQYRSVVSMELTDINKPFSLEAPNSSISLEEAQNILIGK